MEPVWICHHHHYHQHHHRHCPLHHRCCRCLLMAGVDIHSSPCHHGYSCLHQKVSLLLFYSGAAAFFWCLWYAIFARDSPGQMASIEPIERKYIEQSLGVYGQSVEDRLKKRVSCRRMKY